MLLKYVEGSLRDITFRFKLNTKAYLRGCYEICLEEKKELESVVKSMNENFPDYLELKKDLTRLTAAIKYYEDNIARRLERDS